MFKKLLKASRTSLISLICLAFLLPIATNAQTIRPFLFSNQSPFSWIQGLPFTPDAQLLSPKQHQFTLDVAWASHSFKQISRSELLLIDGESVQLNLLWKRGIGDSKQGPNIEIGLLLPFFHQGGGILDSEITQFHSTFGLPHGERRKTPNNQINYRYAKKQNDEMDFLVDVSPGGTHLGDVRLMIAQQWRIHPDHGYNLAWQNELKIPTGKVEDWSGNEAAAISSSIAYDSTFYEEQKVSWQSFSHLGIRYTEVGKVLANQQKRLGVFGGFGLAMQWRSLQLQAQIDAHSATYESQLNAFGPSVQVTFGMNYITRLGLFSLSAGEDIFPETAPDVVFKLAWSRN